MEKSMEMRQVWVINKQPTCTEILDIYPRFKDIDGLIQKELIFVAQSYNANYVAVNICEKWEKVAPILLKNAATGTMTDHQRNLFYRFDAGINDLEKLSTDVESIMGILLLPHLLRPVTQRKPRNGVNETWSSSTVIEHLIQFEKIGATISEVIKCHKQERQNTQPYLLAFTSNGEEAIPDDLFLVLDYTPIRIPGSTTKGVEMLFSSFFAFRVEYPFSLVNVYQFLECQFGIVGSGGQKRGRNATVLEFTQKINQQLAAISSDK